MPQPQSTPSKLARVINFPLLILMFLMLAPPLYHRFEHFNLHPSRHIPTGIKHTAQVAVGSGAAVNTVCRLISKRRQAQQPGGALGMLYCTSMGVAGGAMSAAAMMRNGGWGPREWAWYEGGGWRDGGGCVGGVCGRGCG